MTKKRQHCATCMHIARVVRAEDTYFVCRRLGWRTEPRYQFDCWVERPREVKMAELPERTRE